MAKNLMSIALSLALLAGCGGAAPTGTAGAARAEPIRWAIALHGGAGVISRDMPEEEAAAYLESLERALEAGRSMLEEGDAALDVVEAVIRMFEDDPRFNAGKGAVFNHSGGHELDASIMDGATLACGAVAGVTTVKNPISLARLVMDQTPHVLLGGAGADEFARDRGVELVDQDYFYTERRYRKLQEALQNAAKEEGGGTVGVAALDVHGNLAAGTSTGGLTNKLYGRIGDSPIIGAGTYASNRTCAVSGTGIGEEFIRHGAARTVASLMENRGLTLEQALNRVVHEILRPGDGGLIGVDAAGNIAMAFNTTGMYRGAADSAGRFEVHIWD